MRRLSARHALALGATLLVALGLALSGTAEARKGRWGTAWGYSMQNLAPATQTVSDATVQMIARSGIAGSAVRVKLENTFGPVPLTIGEAYVALRNLGVSLVAGSNYRTWAIDSHHIGETAGFNGDLAAAARSIRARVLLFPNCFDQLLPPRESGVFQAAANIRTVKLVNLDHIAGHGGSGARQALITAEVRDNRQIQPRGRG